MLEADQLWPRRVALWDRGAAMTINGCRRWPRAPAWVGVGRRPSNAPPEVLDSCTGCGGRRAALNGPLAV